MCGISMHFAGVVKQKAPGMNFHLPGVSMCAVLRSPPQEGKRTMAEWPRRAVPEAQCAQKGKGEDRLAAASGKSKGMEE